VEDLLEQQPHQEAQAVAVLILQEQLIRDMAVSEVLMSQAYFIEMAEVEEHPQQELAILQLVHQLHPILVHQEEQE